MRVLLFGQHHIPEYLSCLESIRRSRHCLDTRAKQSGCHGSWTRRQGGCGKPDSREVCRAGAQYEMSGMVVCFGQDKD